MNDRTSVLEELCASLKNNLNHSCKRCMNSKDAESISKCMQYFMCLDDKEDNEMDAIVEE